MPRLNPNAIDTPSRIAQDKSRPTTASNSLLAALVALLILTAGIVVGTQWQAHSTPTPPALPKCSTLAPSFHHALCTLPNGNSLAANGDVFTPSGTPVK